MQPPARRFQLQMAPTLQKARATSRLKQIMGAFGQKEFRSRPADMPRDTMQTRIDPRDEPSVQVPRSVAAIDTQAIGAAPRQLSFDARTVRQFGPHIDAIRPIDPSAVQPPSRQKLHQRIGEQHVDIGRRDESALGTADAHVFGDHLKHGQTVGKCEPPMDRLGYSDEAHLAKAGWRNIQDVRKRPPARGRIPIDQDNLGGQTMPLALRDQPVEKTLHPVDQMAAVIIVPRRRYKREIRTIVLQRTR